MDPSVCRLHPGVAVTGFCPACLRDRLAGLQPPSSTDLRRCKSLSYARSAVSKLEPQRRSCDLFRQEQPIIAVPEEVEYQRRMEAEPVSSRKSSSFGGLLGKKLQQWRRKKKEPPPPPVPEMPSRHRQHSFRIDLDGGRRSCDLDPASWSGPTFDLLTPAMLSVEEDYDVPVPRSDGQIPVEEDCYDNNNAVPGGCAQTRDYYLDSSSSTSRRRRSVDRSTTSGRNSFSDVNSELPGNANARVSPAIAAEFYHAHQRVFVHHHQYRRDWDQPGPIYDFSGSGNFGSEANNKEANKPKKGIKGWSIWGLIHKKRKPEADHGSSLFSSAAAAGVGDQVEEYPWPQLRARGYNGQMLRCNSSISARSSFSGGGTAAMIDGSARRSISGMEMQHDVHLGSGMTRRDEFLLQRNLSTRSSSYSRSGHDHPMGGPGNYQFLSRPNHNGVRSSKSKPSALPRRSKLGPYSTDPIHRQ